MGTRVIDGKPLPLDIRNGNLPLVHLIAAHSPNGDLFTGGNIMEVRHSKHLDGPHSISQSPTHSMPARPNIQWRLEVWT